MDKKRNKNNTNLTKDVRNDHVVLPEIDVPQISEPRPICSICGEPIESIIEAISEQNGGFSHFDCVLSKLKSSYELTEGDTISYIGHGCFGICSKDEQNSYVIKERIQYENIDSFNAMKHFVEEQKK